MHSKRSAASSSRCTAATVASWAPLRVLGLAAHARLVEARETSDVTIAAIGVDQLRKRDQSVRAAFDVVRAFS